jgi:hypothetical protein
VMHPSAPDTTPADSFDNSSSPVLRYLEKYRRSALPEVPGSPPSQRASLPASSSGPITPDKSDADFDISGLPSWMRNAPGYPPEDGSAIAASADENAPPDDRTNIRRLSTFLRY